MVFTGDWFSLPDVIEEDIFIDEFEGTVQPFSFVIRMDDTETDTFTAELGFRSMLESLTVYVVDDGLGPILINAYVIVEGFIHQLKQPEIIWDGVGYNARRYFWVGNLPLSKRIPNQLNIEWANYSGDDILAVRVTGTTRV